MSNQLGLLGQRITGAIDRLNDKVTSYRLVLYFLLSLVGWAVIGSFFSRVPYSWHEILLSAAWLAAVCWAANKLIARFLDIPANKESDLITALILTLILQPPADLHGFLLTGSAGAAAIASKYVITLNKSHIFNPAALGAFIMGRLFHVYPAWWVGTKFITPLLVIGGILVLRKMKRYTMAGLFLAVYLLYLIFGSSSGGDLHFLWSALISTQVLFFAIVMLTEPQTSPSTADRYLPYALLVGVLYSVTKLKISPEEALLAGNLFTLVFATKRRYAIKFVRKIQEAEGIYSYIFSRPDGLSWRPGQYMEWTIAHNRTDSRGNRRYLTISSSPSENALMFTLKLPPQNASAYKQKLDGLMPGETILASNLAGSFTLPADASKKIAFMAGGVGITPFRSMVKSIIDSGQKRDSVLVYSASKAGELAFQDLFGQAAQAGLKSHFVTEGYVDAERIKALVPDYKERLFYVSGPYGFVQAVESALLKLGAGSSQIFTDYFPGYGS